MNDWQLAIAAMCGSASIAFGAMWLLHAITAVGSRSEIHPAAVKMSRLLLGCAVVNGIVAGWAILA